MKYNFFGLIRLFKIMELRTIEIYMVDICLRIINYILLYFFMKGY